MFQNFGLSQSTSIGKVFLVKSTFEIVMIKKLIKNWHFKVLICLYPRRQESFLIKYRFEISMTRKLIMSDISKI